MEIVGRLLGVDQDRAGDGAAAIQGALRALQGLDVLDIQQVLVEELERRRLDAGA